MSTFNDYKTKMKIKRASEYLSRKYDKSLRKMSDDYLNELDENAELLYQDQCETMDKGLTKSKKELMKKFVGHSSSKIDLNQVKKEWDLY